jgi:hypothetical protein
LEEKINRLITTVEKQWLSLLYGHCRKTFNGLFLPSHDYHHHFRVWYFARQLFSALGQKGESLSREMIEQTIIAVFFHDLGLSVTLAETHGAASRDMCIKFFHENKLKMPTGFGDILYAIGKHDDKTAFITHFPAGTGGPVLMDILRTCDDLDAFGYTGAYRYAEIYMLRGIPDEILADRVLNNIANRYRNFSGIFHKLAAFAKQQEYRFRITRDFYSGLKEEISYPHQEGYRHMIIKLFRDKIQSRENLLEPGLKNQITDNNENIQEFFNLLRQENNSWPYPQADTAPAPGTRPAFPPSSECPGEPAV